MTEPRRRRNAIDTVLGLAAIVVLIAVNAVFVAGEFSLVAVDRAAVSNAAAGGHRRARTVAAMLDRLPYFLSGTQLGITVTSLLLGFAAVPILGHALRGPLRPIVGSGAVNGVAAVVAFVIATVGQLVLAELIPKNVAVARARGVAYAVAPLLRIYAVVFSPVIRGLSALTSRTLRVLGVEPTDRLGVAPSRQELAHLVASSGRFGTLDADATRLLTRSIRFTGKTAADALVPRVSVTAIESNASAAALAALAVSSGYSRFPVVEEGLDHVVGVALAKDVLGVPIAERSTTTVSRLMSAVLAVPEQRDLESLLAEMREQRLQLAVVIDEFGDTVGIVTLEDLVEEIVGEIEDEYDDEAALTRGPDGTVLFDATARPDEVADTIGLRLPDDPDYETLAGFFLKQIGRIPAVGDSLDVESWRLTVVEMNRLRIVRIAATPRAEVGP